MRRQDRTRPEDLNDESWSCRLATTDHGDDELERAERHTALLEAFASLTTRQRQLLMLLAADPPVSYAEISRRTGMPVGSIGPTRARACEALRGSRRSRPCSTDLHPSARGGARRERL